MDAGAPGAAGSGRGGRRFCDGLHRGS
jgi:hypothetical protein